MASNFNGNFIGDGSLVTSVDADKLGGKVAITYQQESGTKPVSKKTRAEAGNIGTTGTTITDVYGEADLAAIDNHATFTWAGAWAACESHGGRLPTLEEVMDGCGSGSGQSYDSEYIWTSTPAGPGMYWVVKGAYATSSDKLAVSETALYRTRCFFDVSRANKAIRYNSDSSVTLGGNVDIAGTVATTGALTAASVGVTNIVTNKVVKFNGSILDDSSITDDGATVTVAAKLLIDTTEHGALTVNKNDSSGDGVVARFENDGVDESTVRFRNNGGGHIDVGVGTSNEFIVKAPHDNTVGSSYDFRFTGTEGYVNGNKIWHAGNDGSGSGLDADLLDGKTLGGADGNVARLGIGYNTASFFEIGRGSGAVGLCINDGGGNAQLTFNHTDEIPDTSGSAARLRVDVDSANATFKFLCYDNVTAGTAYTADTTVATIGTSGITSTGSITASGDVTAYSDARLKSDIITFPNALATVKALRGTAYVKDGKASIGVIAQEVEEVLPQVVHTADDEMGTKSVAYGNMMGVMIEAIKELEAKVAELEEKLNGK